MRIQFTLLAFIFSILFLTSCTTHYYIVRHAEKANTSINTPLSIAGMARAQALSDSLESKSINQIYVSNFLRTQQTAQPLAALTGLTPEIYQAPSGMDQLIAQLKSPGNKKNILVVSHSNLVPIIVDSLMQAPQSIFIPETDFDNLFHVKVKKCQRTTRTLYRKTYGVPTN